MSVESQLKREFANFKQHAIVPEELDSRLSASFDLYYKPQKERRAQRHMRGTARFAVVLCGLMLFGGAVYGAGRLFAVTYGSAGIEVKVNPDYTEPAAFGKQTRQVIEEIQTKLGMNESAFLYVSLPGGDYNLLMVNRPQLFTDIESWKAATFPVTGTLAIPGNLPEGYHFAQGMSDSQLGIIDSSWVKKYTNVLTKRLKPGEHYAWIKSFNTPTQLAGTVSPQLVYDGPGGKSDSIAVTFSPAGSKAQLRYAVGADTEVEELKVGSIDALYVVSQQSYDVSGTGYSACIRWMKPWGNNRNKLLLEVSTESREVSKETLLRFAESMH